MQRICIAVLACLALVTILTWSFLVNGLPRPFRVSQSPRLLAEDMLLAASDSVHESLLALLVADEDEQNAVFKRNTMGHLNTKLKWLQLFLDALHGEALRREYRSSVQSLTRRRNATLDICESLSGKRITMVGGEHIYRLHVHFLRHMQHAEGKPFTCPFHEFCTHHHICLTSEHSQDDAQPPRYIKSPTAQELIDSESAIVNYIVSDTLLSIRNEFASEYTFPFVHPMTGIRLREMYWLAAARKADILILGRGPLSAPGQTYTGNWSFLYHMPNYMDILGMGKHKKHDAIAHQIVPRSLDILNAAVHLTVRHFLPELLQLLQSIRLEVHPSRRKRLIWAGSWYRLPGRGAARSAFLLPSVRDTARWVFSQDRQPHSWAEHILRLQLSAFLAADATNTTHLEDPWTFLFNAQVYLQNMVLRELLPQYGIVFLPLDARWDAQARRHGPYMHGTLEAEDDLERTLAISRAFLTRIDYIVRYLD